MTPKGTQKIMFKKLHVKTCSKKSTERKTSKIQRTGPGMEVLLPEIVNKHATVYALVSPSGIKKVRVLTSLWGCEGPTFKITK